MKLPRSKDPTLYASGYTLDLYCDREAPWGAADDVHEFNEFPHQFFGETFAECARRARRRGWIIRTDKRTATCPRCSEDRAKAIRLLIGGW